MRYILKSVIDKNNRTIRLVNKTYNVYPFVILLKSYESLFTSQGTNLT